MIAGLALLLCCQLAGEVAVRLFGLPVPGPVLGMLLLFGLLLVRPHALEVARDTSSALLRHLSLLFLPVSVGLIRHAPRLRAEWLPIAVAILVSTIATFAVTSIVFERLVRPQRDQGR